MAVAEADIDLDIDTLLSELSPDSPCGEDLEYDAAFVEMEQASEGKPEQQFGDTIVESEEPDWRSVKRSALDLFDRTRDLRVATYLSQSLLATDGLPAFCLGLRVLAGLITSQWENVHPQLDPDDDNDPTIRVNALAALCSPASTLKSLASAPLVESRMVGRFSLRDIESATDDSRADSDDESSEGDSGPTMAVISAAFQDVEVDSLQTLSDVTATCIEQVGLIESSVTEQVGAGCALSFGPLQNILKSIQSVYRDQLNRRGVDETSSADGEEATESGPVGESGDSTARAAAALSGDINSREDVIRAIDKALDYYRRYEPSSPLPLLLRRAKRLASLNFMEILEDLAPDGLGQAQLIGGTGDSSSDDASQDDD